MRLRKPCLLAGGHARSHLLFVSQIAALGGCITRLKASLNFGTAFGQPLFLCVRLSLGKACDGTFDEASGISIWTTADVLLSQGFGLRASRHDSDFFRNEFPTLFTGPSESIIF